MRPWESLNTSVDRDVLRQAQSQLGQVAFGKVSDLHLGRHLHEIVHCFGGDQQLPRSLTRGQQAAINESVNGLGRDSQLLSGLADAIRDPVLRFSRRWRLRDLVV